MKKKIIWLLVSCLVVAALLLASCAPAVTEEEEADIVFINGQVVTMEPDMPQAEALASSNTKFHYPEDA